MPLAKWVEKNLVDTLTEGRHTLLGKTADALARPYQVKHPSTQEFKPHERPESEFPSVADPAAIAHQVSLSLYTYPFVSTTLSALRQISTHNIDMGALIRAPEELFASEEAWAGKEWKRRRIEKLGLEGLSGKGVEDGMAYEGPDMLMHVLDHTASVILEHDRKRREGGDITAEILQEHQYKLEEVPPPNGSSLTQDESPELLNLRLNLLALAKRAPLDTIARLPADLVPAHIRCYVPTLG